MKRKLSIPLFFILSLTFLAKADEGRKGEKLFKEKKFKESTEAFLNAEIDEPSRLDHAYNRGVSELQEGNFDGALEAFQKSSLSKEESLKKDSLYNLAHAFYGKGDLESSLKSFDEYLKLDPESKEAKENRAWVEKKIKEQKKQQKKDQDKKDSDKDKDKKDKKDKNSDKSEEKDSENEKKQQEKSEDSEKKEENSQKNSEKDQEQEEKQENSEDKKKEEDKKDSGQSKEEKSSEEKASEAKQATKEEIERVLRSIDNMQKVYGVPPKVPKQKKKVKKDW